MHGGLFGARQRLYDVPVAVDVLIGGRYPHLPKGIEYCGGDIDPRPIFEVCHPCICMLHTHVFLLSGTVLLLHLSTTVQVLLTFSFPCPEIAPHLNPSRRGFGELH